MDETEPISRFQAGSTTYATQLDNQAVDTAKFFLGSCHSKSPLPWAECLMAPIINELRHCENLNEIFEPIRSRDILYERL